MIERAGDVWPEVVGGFGFAALHHFKAHLYRAILRGVPRLVRRR
jgi:hypothetical protein